MKFKEAVQIFIGGIIIIAVLFAMLGFSAEAIDKIISFLIPIGLSLVLSAFAGELIEKFGGSFLKNIFLVVNLWGFEISLSAFTILTFIIKKFIFG